MGVWKKGKRLEPAAVFQFFSYMGKVSGFREYKREEIKKDPVEIRVKHFREFDHPFDEEQALQQGARCMECGIPFCHSEEGCPVENVIPDFNDLIYHGRWKEALAILHSTNNFPEFTGRLCPAPCEGACTLGLVEKPVSIKAIERTIIDRGFSEGWIEPVPPKILTGKKVAVIGSGPAGLAAAQQLARAGHTVTVLEKNEQPGGLLRYGIPDFKLEKWVIDRRIEQLRIEGVNFRMGVEVGKDISIQELEKDFDAMVLAAGSEQPRDLNIQGRELGGIHFAMEYLTAQNRANDEDAEVRIPHIHAKGKHVVVIGGGDTGSDCVGTANRQGAESVTQIELFPMPPEKRDETMPWPTFPRVLKTSSSHEEGAVREWAVNTEEFLSDGQGNVRALRCVRLEFVDGQMRKIPDSQFEIKADLVFLAMGFVHPVHEGMIESLKSQGLELDPRGNVQTKAASGKVGFRTDIEGVYAAGDVRKGQSLIVHAIAEGRRCARQVDEDLNSGVSLKERIAKQQG